MAEKVEVEVALVDHLTKNMTDVQQKLTANFQAMEKSAQSVSNKTVKSFGDMRAPITAVQGMVVGLTALVGGRLVGSFVNAGSEVENLTTQFKVLLGSVSEARKRIKEYAEFGASTPFELGEIARAGRVLQTFGGDVLATGKNLTMIGDIAAGVGQPFGDVAMWVGRMYDALQSGRPWGEAGMRLQEMGALSGEVRAKLEAMQKSGESGQAIWTTFGQEMGRFNGMMGELSKTVTGQLSTSMDLLKEGARSMLAGGAWDGLSDAIGSFNKQLQDLIKSGALEEVGENFGVLVVVLRDMAAIWAGAKIAAGFQSMVIAMRAAATGASALNLTLGPLVMGIGALQIALDAFIASREKAIDKAADVNAWLGDPEKIKSVRDAMLDYKRALEGKDVGGLSLVDTDALAKADAEIERITGQTYDTLVSRGFDIDTMTKARQNALRRSGAQGPATVDIGGEDSSKESSGIGLSQTDIDKNQQAIGQIFDAMEAGRKRAADMVAEAEKQITDIESKAQEERRKNREAAREQSEADNAMLREIEARFAMADAEGDPLAQQRIQQEQELANFKGTEEAKTALKRAHERERQTLERQTMQAAASNTAATLVNTLAMFKSMKTAYKGAAITQVLIDTPAAAMAAYRSAASVPIVGHVLGPAAAVAAMGYGFARVADIAKMEQGGPIYGLRHSQGGVLMEAEGGEYMISRPNVRALGGFAGVESMIRNGGRQAMPSVSVGGMSITINGSATPQAIAQIEDAGQKWQDRVARTVAELLENRNPEMMRAVDMIRTV